MRRMFPLLALLLAASGCTAPSVAVVEAPTPYPTHTPYPTLVLIASPYPTPTFPPATAPPTNTPEPTATPRPSPMPPTEETVTAWLSGMECDGRSPAYGEVVVPEINIWQKHGPDRGRVVGRLPHGTKVDILDTIYLAQESRSWYRVHFGAITGWVAEPFVRHTEAGRSGCPDARK